VSRGRPKHPLDYLTCSERRCLCGFISSCLWVDKIRRVQRKLHIVLCSDWRKAISEVITNLVLLISKLSWLYTCVGLCVWLSEGHSRKTKSFTFMFVTFCTYLHVKVCWVFQDVWRKHWQDGVWGNLWKHTCTTYKIYKMTFPSHLTCIVECC